MLRRLSVYAVGVREAQDTYVWETLDAPTFEEGANKDFGHITTALREYALAGVLHLEHFSSIRERVLAHDDASGPHLSMNSRSVSPFVIQSCGNRYRSWCPSNTLTNFSISAVNTG